MNDTFYYSGDNTCNNASIRNLYTYHRRCSIRNRICGYYCLYRNYRTHRTTFC